MAFPVLSRPVVTYGPGLAILTNGSLAVTPMFVAPEICEVVGARFVNGGQTSVPAPTTNTAASALSILIYKTASNSGSYVATLNNGANAIGSASTSMVLGTLANRKFAKGDIALIQVSNGASNTEASIAAGWMAQLDIVYGYDS